MRATDAFRLGNECASVPRIPACGRRDSPDPPHLQDIAQRTKTSQRAERSLDGVCRQQTGRLDLSSQPRQDLLIEDRCRRARQAFVNDEADRVRADINDGDRWAVIESALWDDRV